MNFHINRSDVVQTDVHYLSLTSTLAADNAQPLSLVLDCAWSGLPKNSLRVMSMN